MSKVTPWFRCNTSQPSKIGWYDIKYDGGSYPADVRFWWDGKKWREKQRGIVTSFGNSPLRFPGDSWRGLAVKPLPTKTQAK